MQDEMSQSAVDFTAGQWKVSVQPLNSIRKAAKVQGIYRRLQAGLRQMGDEAEDLIDLVAVVDFAQLVSGGSTIDGFDIPRPNATAAQLAAAFMEYADLPRPFTNKLHELLEQSNLPDNERKFLPKEALSDEERNFTETSGGPSE